MWPAVDTGLGWLVLICVGRAIGRVDHRTRGSRASAGGVSILRPSAAIAQTGGTVGQKIRDSLAACLSALRRKSQAGLLAHEAPLLRFFSWSRDCLNSRRKGKDALVHGRTL